MLFLSWNRRCPDNDAVDKECLVEQKLTLQENNAIVNG